MDAHISSGFDAEIRRVGTRIVVLGTACEWQLAKAVKAFQTSDRVLAREVVASDEKLNEMYATLETEAVEIMARRHPWAGDLRYLLAVMKIASELERIGDYAANIAGRVIELIYNSFDRAAQLIQQMARTCRWMINHAMAAFENLDIDQAVAVWKKDDEIDEKFSLMMADLQQEVEANQVLVESFADMVFIGRSCERIGDHLTNIAENIYYIETGRSDLVNA